MPFSDLLGEIMGAFGGAAQAQPQGMPMPQPRPPQAPQGPPPQQGPAGPQSPQDYYSGLSQQLPGMMGMPPIDQGDPASRMGVLATGGAGPMGGGANASPMPPQGPPPNYAGGAQQGAGMGGVGSSSYPIPPHAPIGPGGVPMPQPRPPGAGPQGGPQGPPPPQQGPLQTPPQMGGGGPQTQDTMRSALGINPTSNDRGTAFEGALAGGLKGIQGNGRFASFARGLGGGMQGGLNQEQQNLKNNMTVQQQWHNDMSNDFKNTQLLRSTDSNILYKGAYSQILAQRAANADPNNPAKAVKDIQDKAIQYGNYIKNQALHDTSLQKPDGSIDGDAVQARTDAWVKQQYQGRGLNPDQAENIATRGMAVPKTLNSLSKGDWYIGPDGKAVQKTGNEKLDPSSKVQKINPFDGNNMSDDQFHTNVPVSGWVIPRGGTTPKVRTEGPPSGWRGQQNATQQPPLDDYAAAYEANQP
jgi:hypothetical protein